MATKNTLRRKRNSMPAHIRKLLNEKGLMDAYKSRPPYQRNDYLGWIMRAKQEVTRKKRLDQMIRELEKGDVYMNMGWRPR